MEFFEKRRRSLERLKQEFENVIAIKESNIRKLEKELKDLESDKAEINGRLAENILLDKHFSQGESDKGIASGIIEGDVKALIAAAKKKKKKLKRRGENK